MKTSHLLIVCGTVLICAWMVASCFRYRVEFKQFMSGYQAAWFDTWTGRQGTD